ncbi:hypothetical protein [Natrinema sp. J7-1]|uniref:hypothetical protein n=1 Tax=Natrinema sp. J7-1 TaxID=1172566 RepID=UPI001E365BE9|nr:hypothetical protein [Natrinema sp. J7-1]
MARDRVRRGLPGVSASSADIRVYEDGFVTKRPGRRTFVPWTAVSHVRLRNDELVVDRGVFDSRFDRDELEDPEAALSLVGLSVDLTGRSVTLPLRTLGLGFSSRCRTGTPPVRLDPSSGPPRRLRATRTLRVTILTRPVKEVHMTDRESARSRAPDDTTPPDRAFRLAFGGYVGVFVAGLVTAMAVLRRPEMASTTLTGTSVAGLTGGWLAGVALAGRRPGLAVRLGRTRRRRAALVLPAAPFGLAAATSLVGPLESRLGVVALVSAATAALTGGLLTWMAQTRYVDAVTGDAPVATWEWEPPSSPTLDAVVFAMWLLFGAADAYRGDWLGSIVWVGLALLWLCNGLAEGRWRVGSLGATPELRVHEAGLVTQRPYTRSIVLWDNIDHVRLRADELVVDRGLFDVRFDRDELAALEAAHEEIERRLPNRSVG